MSEIMAHTYFRVERTKCGTAKALCSLAALYKILNKMNIVFLGLIAATISTTVAAQQKVYLSENFNSGIPADFTVIDGDQNPIETSLYNRVTFNSAWAANNITDNSNKAAFSFSRASIDYPQENWLITPQLDLSSDGVAYLRWSAKSVHYDFPEEYKVMVSEKGTSPEDFKEVYSVSGESYFWKEHSVSLKDYAGKKVYVAFVCTSKDKYILAIDDVFVGEPEGYDFDVKSTSSHFAGMESVTTVSGVIRNAGRDATVKSIECVTDDGVLSSERNVDVAPEGQLDYTFDMPIKNHSVNHYSIKLRFADDTESTVYTDSVISSYFPRTMVLEEGTGNWCNNCPLMIPYLHSVKERMGNDVVVISAHMGDPLFCSVYSSSDGGVARWLQSLPSTIYNRMNDYKNSDGYHTVGFLERAMLEPTTAMVNFTAEQAGDKININAKATFGVDYDNSSGYYRVGFALVDNLYDQGDISQSNSSTTYTSSEYLYMPVTIPGELMYYHDVAIEGATACEGIEGSLPEQIKAGETYDINYEMQIPEGRTYGDDDLTVVAFIVQSRAGYVLNAAKVPLKLDGAAVGISNVNAADGIDVEIMSNGQVKVTLPDGGQTGVRVYGLDGSLVRSVVASSSSVNVDCNGLKGCYIIEVSAGGNTYVKKVVL